ncbi:hypothetical protein RCL1_008152 [Eukaryota sp. TZLM3-RCL]
MSLLNRNNRAPSATTKASKTRKALPSLDEFITKCDWIGAICYIKFLSEKHSAIEELGESALSETERQLWLAYSYFHNCDYSNALEIYKELSSEDPAHNAHVACCYYHLGNYQEAEQWATKSPSSSLRNRIFFNLAHKTGQEDKLLTFLSFLQEEINDHLALASVRSGRTQHTEALESFKQLIESNPNAYALLPFSSICLYRTDAWEEAIQTLTPYLRAYPSSLFAMNIRACCAFKLYTGEAALQEVSPLLELLGVTDTIDGYLDYFNSLLNSNQSTAQLLQHAILFHNIVVFKNGEGALRVLPKLIHDVPEARLNLAIFYLKAGDYSEAYELLREYEPVQPYEFILKGLVCLAVGQETSSDEHLQIASTFFQMVGESDTEKDTIVGRQAMAMSLFLHQKYKEVLVYLSSVKDFFPNDDDFHFNYGITLAATGSHAEAEEVFMNIKDPEIKCLPIYTSWLLRCFIYNHKPERAWELYYETSTFADSADSMAFLMLMAHDCYKEEQYFFSAKAFDVLYRLDPNAEYLAGKKSSCIGVLKKVTENHLPAHLLPEVISMLQSTHTNDHSINRIVSVVLRYCDSVGISVQT